MDSHLDLSRRIDRIWCRLYQSWKCFNQGLLYIYRVIPASTIFQNVQGAEFFCVQLQTLKPLPEKKNFVGSACAFDTLWGSMIFSCECHIRTADIQPLPNCIPHMTFDDLGRTLKSFVQMTAGPPCVKARHSLPFSQPSSQFCPHCLFKDMGLGLLCSWSIMTFFIDKGDSRHRKVLGYSFRLHSSLN